MRLRLTSLALAAKLVAALFAAARVSHRSGAAAVLLEIRLRRVLRRPNGIEELDDCRRRLSAAEVSRSMHDDSPPRWATLRSRFSRPVAPPSSSHLMPA